MGRRFFALFVMSGLLAVIGVALPPPASGHPYADNHGARAVPGAAGSYHTTLNGIQARGTVPVNTIDVAVACAGTVAAYVTIPAACRSNSNIRGGNLRPMQLGETTLSPEFVATGFGGGCFPGRMNTNGSDCSGIGANGQVYKRRYIDGRNEDFYYFTWYDILNSGSQHGFKIQREYIGSTPYWVHYMDNGSAVTTNQGDTMGTGFATLGGESEPLNYNIGLNVSIQFWDLISVKRPNQAYFVPGQVLEQPHAPACTISYSAANNRVGVTGRC